MLTPTIMLILMTAPYLAACILNRLARRSFDMASAAAVGLGVVFVFTGIGHFVQTLPMAQMLPHWVPQRILLVHATGWLEFAIAAGLFLPHYRRQAAALAIAVLVLFFPVNIYAAFQHVPMGGHAWGPVYLLIRAPLQAVMVAWAYWFVLKPRARRPRLHGAPCPGA